MLFGYSCLLPFTSGVAKSLLQPYPAYRIICIHKKNAQLSLSKWKNSLKRMLFVIFFGLAGTVVLLLLGKWQLERLSWKQDILYKIDSRILAQPVKIPQNPSPTKDLYLPIKALGQFQPTALRVLVSRKQIGAGYRLISAFETDGRRVLVDRGFIKIDTPLPSFVKQETNLLGNLHWPDEIDSYTPKPDRQKNIWFARNIKSMAKELDALPILIVASKVSPSEKSVVPLPMNSKDIPNDHLQYAIIWFSLATVWSVMSLFFLLSKRTKKFE